MRRLEQKSLCPWIALIFLALASLLQPARVQAQGSVPGSVMGTITDATQAVVPDVTVALLNTQTNEARAAKTNKFGIYEFLNVPIGYYRITVEHAGFATTESSAIEVTVQNASVLNLSLRVGTTQETVTMNAEAQVLNTANATLGGLLDNR
jgi:hypothetical protein